MPRKHIHKFRIPETITVPLETPILPIKCSGCSLVKNQQVFWTGFDQYAFNRTISLAEKERRNASAQGKILTDEEWQRRKSELVYA